MNMTFAPVVGDVRPAARNLINHLKTDEYRAGDRHIEREQWMMAGMATSLALAPAAAILMIGMPLSLGAVAIGAAALPTLGVGAMGAVAVALAATVLSGLSARKNKNVANYLNNHIRHLENGGLPHTALDEINKGEGFFQRLANRRAEKITQRANPMLKSAIKNGI